MSLETGFEVMVASCFGSLIQEAIHHWEVRERLELAKYRRLRRSIAYWGITIVMIGIAGPGAYYWFHGDPWPTARTAMLFGFAFPLLMKKVGTAFLDRGDLQLGASPAGIKSLLRAYLAIR
ncbi:MAG: hypothetical protein AB1714_00725 [Acidobacteriota bacterium]